MTTFLLLLIGIPVGLFLLQRYRTKRAARRILALGKSIYSGAHEYAEVSLGDFGHLDAGFYDGTAASLESAGFVRLGDVADLTVTRAGGIIMPTMVRVLVGDGGTTIAGLYHARVTGSRRTGAGNFHILDLETALDDGSFVVTTNATMASAITSPPKIDAEFLPVTTPVPELRARHAERVRAALESRPGLRSVSSSTLQEVLALQEAMDRLKTEYRSGRPGVFDEAELRTLAPEGEAGEALARDVHSEMRRQDGR